MSCTSFASNIRINRGMPPCYYHVMIQNLMCGNLLSKHNQKKLQIQVKNEDSSYLLFTAEVKAKLTQCTNTNSCW